MKKILLALALALFAGKAFSQSATQIQGITPEGGFQTVGVTDNGFLQVSYVGSTTTLTAVQIAAPLPLPVGIATSSNNVTVDNTSAAPVPVQIFSSTLTATAQTTTATTYGAGSNAGGGSAFSVIPANPSRVNSCLINECGTIANGCAAYMRLGDSGVTTSTGFLLLPGATYCPDNPGSFQGQLYAASTAPVSWSWIGH